MIKKDVYFSINKAAEIVNIRHNIVWELVGMGLIESIPVAGTKSKVIPANMIEPLRKLKEKLDASKGEHKFAKGEEALLYSSRIVADILGISGSFLRSAAESGKIDGIHNVGKGGHVFEKKAIKQIHTISLESRHTNTDKPEIEEMKHKIRLELSK